MHHSHQGLPQRLKNANAHTYLWSELLSRALSSPDLRTPPQCYSISSTDANPKPTPSAPHTPEAPHPMRATSGQTRRGRSHSARPACSSDWDAQSAGPEPGPLVQTLAKVKRVPQKPHPCASVPFKGIGWESMQNDSGRCPRLTHAHVTHGQVLRSPSQNMYPPQVRHQTGTPAPMSCQTRSRPLIMLPGKEN